MVPLPCVSAQVHADAGLLILTNPFPVLQESHSSEFLLPSFAPVPFKELVHQLLISPLVFQAWVANSNIWEQLHRRLFIGTGGSSME